ncbi:DNA metabolism protein [Yersinia enterocolitica]|nr:DNA metabolism protein [Yersinia enterocolitica]EKN5096302.1 DNA metabolism protein [Yersinia enterocolitica]EKN5106693.1 DNA metabolism protein [Yersinia enterocolitica]EKN5113146.1 DNA metabolism protein [Yersinia enterocolitica]EKN5122050.1 DNA metabolism protein [Yersinia enterocolitica]
MGQCSHPHVLRVRSGCCALSALRLTATITPSWLR